MGKLIFSIFAIVVLCATMVILQTGCATNQSNRLPGKIFELQYHPVTGQEYSFQGTRFSIDAPLRTKGTTDYFYALQKAPTPLESPEKYLFFDVNIHNPQRLQVYIEFETVELVGSNNDRYRPLTVIKPDTNQTRNLLKILDSGSNMPFIYGVIAFEPVPDWEQKLTLRFRIHIEDLIDEHFVVFEKDTPDPEAVRDLREDEEAMLEREKRINKYTDEQGYIKPADLPKIEAGE